MNSQIRFKTSIFIFLILSLEVGNNFAQNTGVIASSFCNPAENNPKGANAKPSIPQPNVNDTAFDKLQTIFVKNLGQTNNDILYSSWFPQGITIYRDRINIYGTDVYIKENHSSLAEGTSLQQGIFNYFGSNKSISHIPSYGEIVYKDVYPYIDLSLEGMQEGKVEFIWTIHPGGDINSICLQIKGAKIKKTGKGELLVTPRKKAANPFVIGEIYAYQENEDRKQKQVEVEHIVLHPLKEGQDVLLQYIAGNYDKTRTLTIDPIVTAIIRSSDVDRAYSLAIDGTGGNVFIAGYTWNSSNFAPSRTVFGTTGGFSEVFITKLNNGLSSHLATAILAGSGEEGANAIVIDGVGGNVFVAGNTSSSDFAPSRTVFGTTGLDDAFVTKLDNNLSSHLATVILAGSDNDVANALSIDGAGGNIFVAGKTAISSDFAPARTYFGTVGGPEAFVTKLNNGLSSHIATAIVSCSSTSTASSLVIDGAGGNVFIAGWTYNSANFAPSRTVFGIVGATPDAFVTKLNNGLSSHLATAILTGSTGDFAYALAIDGTGGNVFVAGSSSTYSDFSASRTVFGSAGASGGAYVTKLDNGLSSHLATAIITGSSGGGSAYALTIDGAGGNIFTAGETPNVSDFAPSRTVFGIAGGFRDAFVSKLNNGLSAHLSTSILASSSEDYAYALAIDGVGGNVFAAGVTYNESDFAPPRTYFGTAGGRDAFVTTLSNNLGILPVELLTFTGTCSNSNQITLNWQTATEQNNDYFTVETSRNPSDSVGFKWASIGTVMGAGNSSTIRNYEFTDSFPNGEGWGVALYYRLKQTDYNGEYKYYGPISVNCKTKDEWELILQNTPATDVLIGTLLVQENENTTLEIFDLQGRKIITNQLLASRGSNMLIVDLKNISSGVYFLKVFTNEKQLTKKFVKL